MVAAWLWLVPALVAVLLLCLLVAAPVVPQLNRLLTRLAVNTFETVLERERSAPPSLSLGTPDSQGGAKREVLRAAQVATTYRVYAARTYLYAALVAVAGSVLAVYGLAAILVSLDVSLAAAVAAAPADLRPLVRSLAVGRYAPLGLFVLLLVSNATVGVVAAVLVYRARWWWPGYRARERGRRIDASIDRTVAFVYALSRSGMGFPDVMRTLANNDTVYGEAAREVEVAVRDMDLFGSDIHAALSRLSRRTPSESFGDFAENLTSVLQSGRSLPNFLQDQHRRYRDEAASRQSQYLELLATLAEGYVTVFVAGPLFFVTILMVIGLILGGTLAFLRVFVYLLVPLATAGFVVYLDSLSTSGRIRRDQPTALSEAGVGGFDHVRRADATGATRTDGGTATLSNRARLATHERFRWLFERARDPVAYLLANPSVVLWVTVPFAVGHVAAAAYQPLSRGLVPTPAQLDDPLVQGALFVLGTFAVVYEIRAYRVRRVEATMPDFLDRLASVNEAGMPLVASFGRVVESDLGALDAELRRTWTDIRWGGTVSGSLWRLERRLATPAVTRAVTLITNAAHASGDLGPVLRIAADEAQSTRRMRRERRNEMLTYVVVTYLAFLVFLAIVVALTVFFLPAVPTADRFVGGADVTGIGGITVARKAEYKLLFFHAGLVQSVCSGLVAGQMGEDDVSAGAKHAVAMLAVAYLVLVVFG
ncbi:MAG: type II secretion system F family protein [Halobacteriaceae archaeon]